MNTFLFFIPHPDTNSITPAAAVANRVPSFLIRLKEASFSHFLTYFLRTFVFFFLFVFDDRSEWSWSAATAAATSLGLIACRRRWT